jgi:hypothetical protein
MATDRRRGKEVKKVNMGDVLSSENGCRIFLICSNHHKKGTKIEQ